MGGSRGGGGGGGGPLKNHKNIGFPSNIDLDPLKITKSPKNHKATKPAFNSGPLSMAFRWQADNGPL